MAALFTRMVLSSNEGSCIWRLLGSASCVQVSVSAIQFFCEMLTYGCIFPSPSNRMVSLLQAVSQKVTLPVALLPQLTAITESKKQAVPETKNPLMFIDCCRQ